ncbi:alpha/beta hydrolase [soil metagenome]
MPRVPTPIVRAVDRAVVSRGMGMRFGVGRAFLRSLGPLNPMPRGVEKQTAEWGGIRGLALQPQGVDPEPRILYLHGGGYCYGCPDVHAPLVARITVAAGTAAFAARYRLAPEHPYPAGLVDARSAYEAIADAHGPPALVGDSAGAGLALSLALACRDEGLPRPPAVALISPWVDLTCNGESVRANAGKDALLKPQYMDRCARAYANGLERSDSRVSPLFADLEGLGPTLIHVAAEELLLSESIGLAARLRDAGVAVEACLFPGMWHDFHVHAGTLRQADEAVQQLAAWLGSNQTQPAPASA